MAITDDSIEARLGLVKPNFIVDPVAESDFYAYRSDINIGTLVEGLQEDLVTGLAPKRLVWGPLRGRKDPHSPQINERVEPNH